MFARLLAAYRQRLGATSFSVDPYQFGLGNDEAIATGAFWFYRKLGFRSVSDRLERVARREEERLAAAYRTPARTLRRLAAEPLAFEAPGTEPGAWRRFHVRRIGLAAISRMQETLRDVPSYRTRVAARVARSLSLDRSSWPAPLQRAFSDLALVLDLGGGLGRFTPEERALVEEIARAKAEGPEAAYLARLREHTRIRATFLRLGSLETGRRSAAPSAPPR
jgi:hypothetical protein